MKDLDKKGFDKTNAASSWLKFVIFDFLENYDFFSGTLKNLWIFLKRRNFMISARFVSECTEMVVLWFLIENRLLQGSYRLDKTKFPDISLTLP